MLSDIINFFKSQSNNIIWFLIVFALCLFSFGLGVLTQVYLEKESLEIQESSED